MPITSSRRQTTIAALVCLALLPFIRLGEGDLRADEVIYASRAQEVIAQATLLPPVPLRELYGRQPPLTVWMMAASIELFGFSSFSVRLPSAIAFGVLLIGFFWCARRMLPDRFALGATALLASSSLLVRYGRMAQLDLPWLALVVCGIAVFLLSCDLERTWLAVVAGGLLGLSCVAKLFVTALPLLAIGVWVVLGLMRKDSGARRQVRHFGIVIGICALMLGGWIVWMVRVYGSEFFDVAVGYDVVNRAMHGADATEKDTGRLFYVNAVIVGFPAVGLVGVYAIRRAARWWRERGGMERDELFAWLWFLIPFVVLSMVHGKLHSYAVQLLPPLALLVCFAVDELMRVDVGPGSRGAGLGAVVFAAMWGVSQSVRDGAREWFAAGSARTPTGTMSFLIVASIASVATVTFVALVLRRPALLRQALWKFPTIGAVTFVLIRVIVATLDPAEPPATGARIIARSLPVDQPVLLLGALRNDDDAQMQFHCYDASKTLHKRLILMDRRDFARLPSAVPDSVLTAIIDKPDPYFTTDSTAVRSEANLGAQRFVLVTRTPQYDLFARPRSSTQPTP